LFKLAYLPDILVVTPGISPAYYLLNIMTKQPFTPQGVSDLQQELYALPEDLLRQQADLIRNDFLNWVPEHFILDERQQDFFNQLGEDYIFNLSAQLSVAVRNRMGVLLNVSGPSTWISKRLKTSNAITTVNTGKGQISTGGSLTLDVMYE